MLIGRFSAILDACVLFRAHERNLLLWLADDRLFRPLWTADILDEWIASLCKRRPDVAREGLEKLRATMVAKFEDAMVTGHLPFVHALSLPDHKDRHVLAAAIASGADAIVTRNLKDFPEKAMRAFGKQAIHPDVFIVNMIDLAETRALAALRAHRLSLRRSCPDAETYLANFQRCGLPRAHARLTAFAQLL